MQAAVVEGRAVVTDGITGGGELAIEVVGAAAQYLARHLGIAEILQAQVIEVVQATADGQVLAPPVRVAGKGDGAAGVDLADFVRAAAQRGFIAAAIGEIAGLPPVFGEYRQGGDIQGQGAVFIAGKVKTHLALAFDFDVLDVGEQGAKAQAALGHQQVEAVAHIFGGDRLAVGKTRLGVEVET